MREEAASAGFFDSPWGTRHLRVQILTVAELLDGRGIDYPARGMLNVTYRQAPLELKRVAEEQAEMDFGTKQ
jgi:adenine-specific DNA-methyltransferase